LFEALGPTGPPDVYLVGLATLSLLGDVGSRRPIAVLVDDAHSLDGASLAALSFVAQRLDADPIRIVIACPGDAQVRGGAGRCRGRGQPEVDLTR
jgi:hypothetical protein